MNTIKTIFTVAILFTSMSICAQDAPDKKVTFGVKAGLNLSDITSSEGSYENTKTKAGFHAGVTLDFAITPQWYILTGLEYTSKGVKIELSPNDQDVTAAYVQLPISGAYKLRIREDMAFLFNLGPYFAYGVNGKMKLGSHKEDTFSDDALKNFDCGMVMGAAFEWNKLCFTLGGELGFVNITQEGNDKMETRNFTLSVGYKF